MTNEIQDSSSTDLQELELETFKVEELTDLDQNAATASISLCSSTTTSTTSSSCG